MSKPYVSRARRLQLRDLDNKPLSPVLRRLQRDSPDTVFEYNRAERQFKEAHSSFKPGQDPQFADNAENFYTRKPLNIPGTAYREGYSAPLKIDSKKPDFGTGANQCNALQKEVIANLYNPGEVSVDDIEESKQFDPMHNYYQRSSTDYTLTKLQQNQPRMGYLIDKINKFRDSRLPREQELDMGKHQEQNLTNAFQTESPAYRNPVTVDRQRIIKHFNLAPAGM